MTPPDRFAGSASQRTRLATTRTALAAAGLAVLLFRAGLTGGSALDVADGVLAALLAVLLLAFDSLGRARIAVTSVLATVVAVLVLVQVCLTR